MGDLPDTIVWPNKYYVYNLKSDYNLSHLLGAHPYSYS